MPALTVKKNAIGSDVEAFYSIKIGRADEPEIRNYCLDNNMVAISFSATAERHKGVLERLGDDKRLAKFLEKEKERASKKDNRSRSKYWVNQHLNFYRPQKNTVWLTTYESKLYYSYELDDTSNIDNLFEEPDGSGWVKRKIKGWKQLDIPLPKLPGQIRNLSIQRQTIVIIDKDDKGEKFELIKNVLNGEKPNVDRYNNKYFDRSTELQTIISKLGPNDLETLIDLILYRMAYSRESVLGEQEKDIDGLYQDLRSINNDETKDMLYTQVKSKATLEELNDFVEYIESIAHSQSGQIALQGIFAYHTSQKGKSLTLPSSKLVKVWDLPVISEYTVRLGLENWVLDRVYA